MAFVIVVVVEFNSVFVVSDGAVVDFIVLEKSMGKFFQSDKDKNSIDQKKNHSKITFGFPKSRLRSKK